MNAQNRRDFMKSALAAAVCVGAQAQTGQAEPAAGGGLVEVRGNPILPGRGVCDPQVRIFNGSVYLYATHDYSPKSRGFRMDNWWVWHSDDLVHWSLVSILKPEETFLRRPFTECWATDAASRNGKYYFYFSAGPKQIGVVVGDTPVGPWKDPLGKPLIPEGLTPVEERDPGILMDDDGSNYIVFGTWDYYIARLNDDMISLAEAPRLIKLDHKAGPYGEGKTDDKPFLHKRHGIYYLSWGCFYAMADNPYGPYTYKGSIVTPETTAADFQTSNIYRDRHGSFFQLHGQWYFACNDRSQKGSTPYFRNSILSYLHYRSNGEMAPIRISRIGVGQYDVAAGPVEAEDFFKLAGGEVKERPGGGFEVRDLANGSLLVYPNVQNLPPRPKLILRFSNGGSGKGRIEVREGSIEGRILGHATIPSTTHWDRYADLEVPLTSSAPRLDLAFVFRGHNGELARLDSWRAVV